MSGEPQRGSTAPPGERGAVILLALLALLLLLALGAAAVLAARTGPPPRGVRGERAARRAAEAGVAAAIDWLAGVCAPDRRLGAALAPGAAADLPGNGALPGDPRALLDPALGASHTVTIANDAADPGLARGADEDGVVWVRSLGAGPGGALVTVEARIEAGAAPAGACAMRLAGWREGP